MYSLFWKIFFSFWLIILVTELLTAWFTADLSEHEIHPTLRQHNEKFVASTTNAVSILTRKGLLEFREWISNERNILGVDEIYVFDKANNEVNNKPFPKTLEAILDSETYQQILLDHYQPIKHTLRFEVKTLVGDEFLVISTFAHPSMMRYLLAPQRVALSVVISGIICFFLARYFTSPLTNLRRSTQKMMLGDFDTTGLKRLRARKDEFGALAMDFNTMTVRLSNLLDNQRQLLRDISHELNSPLSRLRVALELARSKYRVKDQSEFNRIELEIERLEMLIQELLTFVRIDPRNSKASMSRVDVAKMLEEIVEDAKYLRRNLKYVRKISLHCAENVDVNADARLLHRAVENIVRNACYYSPDGAAINIRCAKDDRNVYIFVEDQGPGVPENMLEQIFSPFVRVSSARETDTGGSGIGLAIAKRVVEIHNGTIKARNKKDNGGLIVAVSIPLYSQSIEKPAA